MERFTHNKIANLTAKTKRYHITEGNGFCLRVTPKGVKTWFYRYKHQGKEKWLTIGHFPAMTVAEARQQFNTLWSIKQSGRDPESELKRADNAEKTLVKSLIDSWYKNYIEKHRKQPLQIKQLIDADIIPLLGHYALESIKTLEITKALDKIVERGACVHANKVLSAIKQAFNYAVSRGEMPLNPAANIRSRDIGGIEKPRDRYLSMDEIKVLWQFLDSTEHGVSLQVKNAIKIILLTGVRSGELRLAQWQEFDFEGSMWTIPAEKTKTGITMKVHLSTEVIRLLKELQAISESDYVITGVDGIKSLTDRALPRAINRIQQRVGIPRWTAHDLRRTFATQLGETLHVDPVVIEKCLGHKMPKIMATYNKNEMLPQRKAALESWESHLVELVSRPE